MTFCWKCAQLFNKAIWILFRHFFPMFPFSLVWVMMLILTSAEVATLEHQHQQQREDNVPSSSSFSSQVINQPRGDASSTHATTVHGKDNQCTITSDTQSSSSSSTFSTSSTVQHQQEQHQRTGTNGDSGSGLLLSFEELRERVLQKEKNDRWSSSSNNNKKRPGGGNLGHMIDSVDGGFADDFGAMFEVGQGPPAANVYDEDEYIEPSRGSPAASATANIPNQQQHQQKSKSSKINNVPIKSLKERFNYASIDCAATVRAANKEAKGAQSILYESKDQYLLNKCSANKYVIINLCEPVLIDTIVMANFEFFSSTFSEFRVYVADRYPTNDWKLLGQWQARNTRDLQVFKVKNRFGWFENIKIEFLSHYGHEYYCPLSLVRVHGMTMMEYFFLVEGQDDGDDYELEDEFLWPSEVRDEIIHPNIDSMNDTRPIIPEQEDHSENHDPPAIFPVNDEEDEKKEDHSEQDVESEHQQQQQMDGHISKEDVQPIESFSTSVSAAYDDLVKSEGSTAGLTEDLVSTESGPEPTHNYNDAISSPSASDIDSSASTTYTPSILPTELDAIQDNRDVDTIPGSSLSTSIQIQESMVPNVPITVTTNSDSNTEFAEEDIASNKEPSTTGVEEQQSTLPTASYVDTHENDLSSVGASTSTVTSSSSNSGSTVAANAGSLPNTASSIGDSAPTTNRILPKPSNAHKDNSYTQESIYKTIMKRLNALELNVTLSQRYLDEQNKMLNDVFINMEKRHQDQIILLLGRLNDTASTRIDGMKRRYEQAYDELQQLTENNMKEMTIKMALMADQIAFERRVSMAQLVIVVMLFVFVALSRGTLSILSPIMEAQAQERKRRESADAQALLEVAPLPINKTLSPPVLSVTPESIPSSPRHDEHEIRPRGNSLFRESIPRPRRRWSDNGGNNLPLDIEPTFMTNDPSLRFVRRRNSSGDAALVPTL
ncbi:UNC-like C-terminal-domain-containing protein [Phascolomyces articulosus]|uniref:SUN-like protein 1 n=1 Tax=Phascolomyces articulosus TaxID=60185 RepID=A0AAD5JQ81_9FUNG|nr:UNC-like C-terminal-domain-containing protein [Phascolomyces articulosus]